MTLSVMFLMTTLPNVVYFLKVDDWIEESSDERSEARLRLGFVVTNLLYYTNSATNFFLYCLAGSRFRRAMCQTFRCRRRQEGRSRMATDVGGLRASRSRAKTSYVRQRTDEPPMISSVPAAEAGGSIIMSTHVTIHRSH